MDNISRVVIEVSSIDGEFVVIRVPVLDQPKSLMPVRINRDKVSKFNISGVGCLAEFYKFGRKFQRTNFIPYSIAKHLYSRLTFPKFGDVNFSKLKRRFSDIQERDDGEGRFLLIEYTEKGRDFKLLGYSTFDSIQCVGSFHRAFHKKRHEWKLMTHQTFLERVQSGEIKIDYANRFTRKLVSEDALPREEQWKKELRAGIQ